MSIVKKIRKTCILTLGSQPERWDDTWDQVKELTDVYGERKVSDTFDEWAETRKGDIIARPIGEFLKVAPGLLSGITSVKPNPALSSLLNDLAYSTDNNVVFDKEQQATIARLLSEHGPDDIRAAFKEFYGRIEGDDYAVRRAAKTFVETSDQLLYGIKRRRDDARKQQELIIQKTNYEQARVTEELAEYVRKQAEETSLFEETLPE